jgi:hypothetical protein
MRTFLQRSTVFKYIDMLIWIHKAYFKVVDIFLKIIQLYKGGGGYGWNGVGEWCVYVYNVFSKFLSFIGECVLYERALLVLMVACVLFWVQMEYFESFYSLV